MRRRILMIIVIFLLLIAIFYANRKNEIVLPSADIATNNVESYSVVNNTTTNLKSNNGKFDRVSQMLEKIEYRYKILKLQDTPDFNIDSEIASIKSEIEDKKSLIQSDENTYNRIILNLEDINRSIENVFYSLGIEFVEDDFRKQVVKIDSIEENIFTCSDENTTYTIDVSKIEDKDTFAVGDTITVFYSQIVYENNIGKISSFYIEKL